MTISSMFFWKKSHEKYEIFLLTRTALARTLNLIMFAACIVAVFILVRKYLSLGSARMASLIFATSAGFVPYQIFLTTDLAVIFMMLASFLFAVRITNDPGMANSIAAGLLAGLAAATKYNGLAVAAALPLAHLLACRSKNPIWESITRKSAWVCGLCVPIGFLLGNPYTIFDWQKFKADFLYNYAVTPVYNGVTTGNGYKLYSKHSTRFWIPWAWFLAGAAILRGNLHSLELQRNKAWRLWLLAAAIFTLYTYKIGHFRGVETRFVLPAAPFLLIMAAAGFIFLLKIRWVTIPLLAGIVAYNIACVGGQVVYFGMIREILFQKSQSKSFKMGEL
jgi:4-amino-4-deoxy-L-arabinose transferase-like glycosyltransferase